MAVTHVIGLDIGSTTVRAAELEFGKNARTQAGAPTVIRIGQVPLPLGAVRDGEVVQPETVSSALRRLWSESKFQTKDVVIGVGNQRVIVREMELPWMPLAEIKKSLPYQVSDSLPMSVDDALLDYHAVAAVDTPQGRMVHGLLVAAQRDTVTSNVLAVEGAGLRPSMVDLNGFALLRALARGDFARANVAFVDIGASVTTVVVATHGSPRLVRYLPVGGHSVTSAVAAAMSISAPDAEVVKREVGVGYGVPQERQHVAEAVSGVVRGLVEGIRNTFVYFQGNNPGQGIDVIVLTGGGSQLPGLGQYLSSASRLPVTTGDALAGLKTARTFERGSINGNESSFALSIGLAYGVAA